MTPSLPPAFVEAVRNRRLLPFIGAGFSKNVDRAFPNWSEVIRLSAQLLDCDPEILQTQGDYLQIAEYLAIRHRLGDLYNALAKQLDDDRHSVGVSRPHILLPYLDVQTIFTTNWDSWIERGFEHEHIPYDKIITPDDFLSPRVHRPKGDPASPLYSRSGLRAIRKQFDETTIVKFHGDFAEHPSIVFRESDYYDRLALEHPLDIKLRYEIIGRSVLFIGYSFSDPNVRYIWHKLGSMTSHIAAGEQVKSFFVTHLSNPLQTELFRRQNIETILLNPKDIPGDLALLFEHMIDLQKR